MDGVLQPFGRRIFPDEEGTESEGLGIGLALPAGRRIFPDEEGTERSVSRALVAWVAESQNLPR